MFARPRHTDTVIFSLLKRSESFSCVANETTRLCCMNTKEKNSLLKHATCTTCIPFLWKIYSQCCVNHLRTSVSLSASLSLSRTHCVAMNEFACQHPLPVWCRRRRRLITHHHLAASVTFYTFHSVGGWCERLIHFCLLCSVASFSLSSSVFNNCRCVRWRVAGLVSCDRLSSAAVCGNMVGLSLD